MCVGVVLVTALGACTQTSLSAPSGSVVKCQVTLTGASSAAPANGGNASVAVAAAPECAWTASTQAPWISDLAPTSGQGGGTIQFRVAPNSSPAARQGDIVVNDLSVRVSQDAAPCQLEVTPRTVSVSGDGGNASTSVTALAGCPWTATSEASWLTITSGQTGDGNGTVAFTAAPNPDANNPRSGTLVVGGLSITVTQQARNCTFTLTPPSQNFSTAGGTGTVSVAVPPGVNCGWTATPDVPWITVTSGSPGTGSASFGFSVAANTGVARTGRISVGGALFTVTQDVACAFSLAPNSQSFAPAGGSGSTTVTTNSGCTWTAASNDSWITVTGGTSGSGPGQVTFNVAVNSNTSGQRSGSLTIAGQSFTVNQSPAPCMFSIAPNSQNVPAAAGSATAIAVTTTAGCAWTASTGESWLHIGNGSGNGPGSVAVTVDVNSGPARTGQLSVAGQTASIVQAAGCSFALAPSAQSIGASGGAGAPISLTTAAGCAWTVVSNDSWISLTSPATGAGPATITINVAANILALSARSGSLTVVGTTATATVNQAAPVCTFSLNPTSQSIGSAAGAGTSIDVTALLPICTWTATVPPSDTWIHLTGATTGLGNGSVPWTYDANTGPARSGAINITGQTFTVSQASGCTYSTPTPPLTGVPGNVVTSGSFAVATGAACPWTAMSNDPWLIITGGTAAGSGPGTVTFEVAANPTGAVRTGTFSLQGQPIFRVIQDP